jgi:hypothetical protein
MTVDNQAYNFYFLLVLELSIPNSITTSEAGLNDTSPSLYTEVLLWFQIIHRRKLDGGVVEKLASRTAAP